MKRCPRRMASLAALLLLLAAGLIASPREGAAIVIGLRDGGQWGYGEPDTPNGGGRVQRAPAGDWMVMPVVTPFGLYSAVGLPMRLVDRVFSAYISRAGASHQ